MRSRSSALPMMQVSALVDGRALSSLLQHLIRELLPARLTYRSKCFKAGSGRIQASSISGLLFSDIVGRTILVGLDHEFLPDLVDAGCRYYRICDDSRDGAQLMSASSQYLHAELQFAGQTANEASSSPLRAAIPRTLKSLFGAHDFGHMKHVPGHSATIEHA